MGYTLTFLVVFVEVVILSSPLLFALAMMVTLLGQIVAYLEKWSKFDAFYWSFITATTVGYGDIQPLRKSSRLISILIAFIGIMFTGIIVAITIESARAAFNKYADPTAIEKLVEEIGK